MGFNSCPGSKMFKQPYPEDIKCQFCGRELEIWSDELKRLCPYCGNIVNRSTRPTCFDWCKYAKECAGLDLYNRYMKEKIATIKESLIKKLEDYFGSDKHRIEHAKKVLSFAEQLIPKEDADWHIVIPASILHDIGIKEAEKKYKSSAGYYQQRLGPPIARKMLIKVGLKKEDIDQICEIIAYHHTPGKINTQNFKVLYDADCLVNLCDEVDIKDKQRLKILIDNKFLTESAKKLAREVYLSE